MVTTQGAGSGGRLCDKDSRSCAASVSSTLLSRKTLAAEVELMVDAADNEEPVVVDDVDNNADDAIAGVVVDDEISNVFSRFSE